jgi:tautomerase-like protein
VHAALMEGIKTPDWDKTIRLVVHEPHRFATPPGKDERYTLVDIDLFSGRSLNAKRSLYRAIVNNLGKLGIPADHIKVLLRESAAEKLGRSRRRAGVGSRFGFQGGPLGMLQRARAGVLSVAYEERGRCERERLHQVGAIRPDRPEDQAKA